MRRQAFHRRNRFVGSDDDHIAVRTPTTTSEVLRQNFCRRKKGQLRLYLSGVGNIPGVLIIRDALAHPLLRLTVRDKHELLLQ